MKFIILLLICINLYATNKNNDAIILLYHHIDDATPISTSTTIEKFQKHLEYLNNNSYNVLPLETILEKFKNNKQIPKKTVAITFDDAYISVYKNAFPILKKYNYPFTIFVNTSPIGHSKLYMTWNQLKETLQFGASIGSHSHYHDFLIRKDYEYIYNDLLKAHTILKNNLNIDTKMFAYPFGEYTKDLEDIVRKFNYNAFSQKSGVFSRNTNFIEIPRYSLSSFYANMDRFKMILKTKALNPKEVKIENRIIKQAKLANSLVSIKFINDDNINLDNINCFDGLTGDVIKLNRKRSDNFMEISFKLPNYWSVNRQKINCTAPSKNDETVFYWHSELFYIISNENEWYKY